jgi:DNA polymerase-3 subunit delta'
MLDEVREQPNGVRFLRRVVEGKFMSPLLLLGDDGVGRRFSVFQATKEMFCSESRAANCQCVNCYQLDQGMHPDLTVISPENGEIKVTGIRDMVRAVKTYPSMAPVKVFIIDGADKMNPASANALLKTLEEPPTTVRIFLLAESAAKVLPTIRSRCGLVQYRSLSMAFIEEVLRKSEDDEERVSVIARMSGGSLGLAVQYWGSGRLALRDKVFGLLRLGSEENLSSLFSSVDALDKELPLSLRFLEQLVHDLIMVQDNPTGVINTDIMDDIRKLRDKCSRVKWYVLLDKVRELREKIRSRIVLPFHVKNLFVQAFWVPNG